MTASWSTAITLVPAVLAILAVAAFVFQMRLFEKRISRKLDALRHELERAKDKSRRDDLQPPKHDVRADIASLKSLIGNIPHNTAQLIVDSTSRSSERSASPPSPRPPIAARTYQSYEETQQPEDGVAVLLQLANRIARNGSMTLDAFRDSTSSLGANVTSWSGSGESGTTAFIVDYRGSSYVIPNVVKPARLRKEWFNSADFGVNNEIQHITSLPRVRRSGGDYEVLQAGEFSR